MKYAVTFTVIPREGFQEPFSYTGLSLLDVPSKFIYQQHHDVNMALKTQLIHHLYVDLKMEIKREEENLVVFSEKLRCRQDTGCALDEICCVMASAMLFIMEEKNYVS